MARLVIRIKPNDHPTDPSLTPLRTNVGDVVELVDDPHQFSKIELTCGHYRFLDVPGVSQDRFMHLKDHVNDAEGTMIQRRRLFLDHLAEPKLPELTPEIVALSMDRDQAAVEKYIADEALYLAKSVAKKAEKDAAFLADLALSVKEEVPPDDPLIAQTELEAALAEEKSLALADAVPPIQAEADTKASTLNAIEKIPELVAYVDAAVAEIAAITFIKPVK